MEDHACACAKKAKDSENAKLQTLEEAATAHCETHLLLARGSGNRLGEACSQADRESESRTRGTRVDRSKSRRIRSGRRGLRGRRKHAPRGERGDRDRTVTGECDSGRRTPGEAARQTTAPAGDSTGGASCGCKGIRSDTGGSSSTRERTATARHGRRSSSCTDIQSLGADGDNGDVHLRRAASANPTANTASAETSVAGGHQPGTMGSI